MKNSKDDQEWLTWLLSQSEEDLATIACSAIERLIELEEVSFRKKDSFDPDLIECLYWDSNGEDLRIPF